MVHVMAHVLKGNAQTIALRGQGIVNLQQAISVERGVDDLTVAQRASLPIGKLIGLVEPVPEAQLDQFAQVLVRKVLVAFVRKDEVGLLQQLLPQVAEIQVAVAASSYARESRQALADHGDVVSYAETCVDSSVIFGLSKARRAGT